MTALYNLDAGEKNSNQLNVVVLIKVQPFDHDIDCEIAHLVTYSDQW